MYNFNFNYTTIRRGGHIKETSPQVRIHGNESSKGRLFLNEKAAEMIELSEEKPYVKVGIDVDNKVLVVLPSETKGRTFSITRSGSANIACGVLMDENNLETQTQIPIAYGKGIIINYD